MLKKNVTYAFAQGGYWMNYCCAMSFASVLLLNKGYTNTRIGIILAISNLIAVFFQQIIAKMADRSKKIPLSVFLLSGYLIQGICSAILIPIGSANSLFTFLFAVQAILTVSMQGLVNALCFRLEDERTTINFGVGRGIGSLTFGIISIFIGNIAEGDVSNILLASVITAVFNILVYIYITVRFDTKSVVSKIKESVTAGSASFFEFFSQYKLFFLMLFGVLGAWLSHSMINIYFYQILETVGGDSKDLGGVLSFAAILEIIPMFLYSTLERKFGTNKLIVASVFFFFMKSIVTAFSVNVYMVYVGTFFQMFSFAIFIPASASLVNKLMNKADAVRGHAMITVTSCLGSLIASLSGGFILDKIGVRPMLIIVSITSAIGTVITFVAIRMMKKRWSSM